MTWPRRLTIPHGTLSGYRYWKCKCADCRKANTDAQAEFRARRIRNGWCLRCGGPSRPHMVNCRKCAAKDSARCLRAYYAKKGQLVEAIHV